MTSGLRRFLRKETPTEQELAEARIPRCEMCNMSSGEDHGHVVDLESRAIMCVCRPCYLVFTPEGAGGKRFSAIPERYLHTDVFTLDQSTWESIGIPVRMAFFFTNSQLDADVCFYPSPAGATESLLPLEQWRGVLADNPDFADAQPDVEALLVNRTDGGFECFLVPIDRCYHLVGLVKLNWRGFDGGTEAWTAIDAFFDDLRRRSRKVGGGVG